MNGKILLAAMAAIVLLMAATPAMAQLGACGGVAYGPPQDCMATVSCNVPVTQMVPVPTCNTVMQPVQVPVQVPVQSSITVPRQVCVPEQVPIMVPQVVMVPSSVTVPRAVTVPEQVPITTFETTCVTQQVPVQVPGTAYQPVTSMVPQVYSMPLSSLPMGANAPGGLSKGAPNMPMNTGLGKGMGMGMGKNI
jgi:hypothetical protein